MWQAGGPLWGTDFSEQDCVDAILRAHELGVNLVDTAEAYGNGKSEELVGRAIERIGRDELVLATKVVGNHLRYDHVLRACERSLKALGSKEIDLYQIHWPDPWAQVPLRHTMRAMETLYKEGKIRSIGVSNFAVRDLEEARSLLSVTDIASNQIRYNILDREVEEEVLPYCRRENISVLAWSPLAKGILTGKYTTARRPGDELRKDSPYFREENLRACENLLSVLKRIGAVHGKSAAQVSLAWLKREGGVIPIPGAKNPVQAEENIGAAGWSLTPLELEEIEAARSGLKLDLF